MWGQEQEERHQHMLLVVEAAQRAGRSEREIKEIVEEAAVADAALERAA